MPETGITATIKDQVYHLIKREICERQFRPGQWLQENELAQYYNVSRSPVREALRLLASDGLVVNIPNKGVFVREFSTKDMMDIFDMRNLMESYAIRRSQDNRTTRGDKELSDLGDEIIRAHANNDLKQYLTADASLHQKIIELGGNTLICSTYERLRSMLHPFRIYSLLGNRRFDESVKEHADIVKYILQGNVEKAVEVSSFHLNQAREAVIQNMNNASMQRS